MSRRDRPSRTRATRSKAEPAYARTTITIPLELKARMEKLGGRVNWSAIASEAFESRFSELEQDEPMPELPDKNDALQRLKRLRDEPEFQPRGKSSRPYVLGKRWAMADAHPNELQRLEEFVHRCEIIHPLDELKAGPRERHAVKELFRDLTLSILGYKDRPNSIGQTRVRGTDVGQVRREVTSFWEEGVGVKLHPSSHLDREFLSEFTQGALDFWKEAKDQL
jgi:hypothetical protein